MPRKIWRKLSIPNMLVPHSPLQEELTTLDLQPKVCVKCGIEYQNEPFLDKCKVCDSLLIYAPEL